MIIQHNKMALFASNQLKTINRKRTTAMDALSSGYRINRSADDAAGLSISEKMRGQIRGLDRAALNIDDGINYVQVADGALQEVTDIVQRIRELSVQAASDTNTDADRAVVDSEVQQLKAEVDSILDKTEFNTIKIWDLNTDDKIQIGVEQKQAVTITSAMQSFTITDTNKGAVPKSTYRVNVLGTDPADPLTYGASIEWTGYNGTDYSTSMIGWDVLAKPAVNFNISDYLDTVGNPELAGMSLAVSYAVTDPATVADVAAALNGVQISTNPNTSQSISNTQTNGTIGMGVSLTYLAQLASNRSMDVYDTTFIEANVPGGLTSNVNTPDYSAVPIDSTGLTFDFSMNNIGDVTGTCYDIYYYSNDKSPAQEGKWWQYVTIGTTQYQVAISHAPAVPGTGLDSILSCVNRTDGLSMTEDADSSGYIIMNFNLTSTAPFSYGVDTTNSVGNMSLSINVGDLDTQQDLIDTIQANFNALSVVDVYAGSQATGTPSSAYDYMYKPTAQNRLIDVPIYQAIHDVTIQAGANENQAIHVVYDSIRTTNLGLATANTLTTADASNAIDQADFALDVINGQRAQFGSYGNRMEHAKTNAENTAENLQSAESRIRDTNMAKEMAELAKYDILDQAATAMLSQANRSVQSVLKLLE